MTRLKIIKSKYLDVYRKKQPITLSKHFKKLKERPFELKSFGYWAAYSSVYSSMIEGNNIDFDTYLKFTASGMNTNSKPMREIENLKDAYEFASTHALNKKNILEAHKILSKELVEEQYQGVIRDKEVYIFGGGELVYTGAKADIVKAEMDKLFDDIAILRKREMSMTEVFYYASMIHLTMVKIHPFADGNGRISRLVEKWFLADKLGKNAWYIASEKLYRTRIKSYYKHVDLGTEYETNNFNLCIPFLKMLPMALRIK
ncbi:Fic family protein [Saccharicrinis sp. GN24d3]|uniref:Fic family protein n=1 Tax=Saccharicrinis sp. GN24d3 TaxID=3458416 RepID=UPI0040351253